MNRPSDKPILMEKPRRGREMKTKEVPKDMMETMRVVSAKKTLNDEEGVKEFLGQKKTGDVELYHEGYVDGKLYLVPDSNLEAMKSMVDTKMRRAEDSRYHGDPASDSDSKAFERYQKKLENMHNKLEVLDDDSEESIQPRETTIRWGETPTTTSKNPEKEPSDDYDEESVTEEEPTIDESPESAIDSKEPTSSKISSDEESEKEPTIEPSGDSRKPSIASQGSREPSISDSREPSTTSQGPIRDSREPSTTMQEPIRESRKSEQLSDSQKRPSLRSTASDTQTLRFLLSGHCRPNSKPIFIIQPYKGKSPFGAEDVSSIDVSSARTENNVDIFVTGKFFKESILEEVNNWPQCLKINSDKILIDDRSRVYEESFADVFNVGEYDVEFEGRFILNPVTKQHTPVLSIGVKKSSPSVQELRPKKYIIPEKTPTMVYISRPSGLSPFRESLEIYQKPTRPSTSRGLEVTVHEREPHLKSNSNYHRRKSPLKDRLYNRAECGDIDDHDPPVEYKFKKTRRESKTHFQGVLGRISQIIFPSRSRIKNDG